MAQNNIKAIELLSIDSASFDGSYMLVGKLSNSLSIMRIINNSDSDILVSYDGENDHDVVQTMTTMQISFQQNNKPNGNVANLAANTPIYVLGTTGQGEVYIAGYYSPVGG